MIPKSFCLNVFILYILSMLLPNFHNEDFQDIRTETLLRFLTRLLGSYLLLIIMHEVFNHISIS